MRSGRGKEGSVLGVAMIRNRVFEGARVGDSKGVVVQSSEFPPDRSVDPGRATIQDVLDSELLSE